MGWLLSNRDAERTEQVVRRVERLTQPDMIRRRRPAVGGDGTICRARVKTTPGAVATVVCNLTDADGEEVTVTCDICNGTALNAASPRLAEGDYIAVYQEAGTWRCATTFQTTEDCVCTAPE